MNTETQSITEISYTLRNFLDSAGRLTAFPAKRKMKLYALVYLSGVFEGYIRKMRSMRCWRNGIRSMTRQRCGVNCLTTGCLTVTPTAENTACRKRCQR